VLRGQHNGALRLSRPEPLLFLPTGSSIALTRLVAPGIEPGPLDLQPGTLTTRPQRRSIRLYTAAHQGTRGKTPCGGTSRLGSLVGSHWGRSVWNTSGIAAVQRKFHVALHASHAALPNLNFQISYHLTLVGPGSPHQLFNFLFLIFST
jgi:hypothetical protein